MLQGSFPPSKITKIEGVSKKIASTQVSLGLVGDEKVSLSQEGW